MAQSPSGEGISHLVGQETFSYGTRSFH